MAHIKYILKMASQEKTRLSGAVAIRGGGARVAIVCCSLLAVQHRLEVLYLFTLLLVRVFANLHQVVELHNFAVQVFVLLLDLLNVLVEAFLLRLEAANDGFLGRHKIFKVSKLTVQLKQSGK